jgi:carboxylesterase type B
VHHPKSKGFATVVWFHGGGLTGGNRGIPDGLKDKGIAIVAAGYRLNPDVKSPTYIEDAAAAVAWTVKNIGKYGGDPNKIFVSGHSAYLVQPVCRPKQWNAVPAKLQLCATGRLCVFWPKCQLLPRISTNNGANLL